MFCYQCEQTSKGQGCTVAGVCGKTADVSALQDLLVYMLRGLGQLVNRSLKAGVRDEAIDLFTLRGTIRHFNKRQLRPRSYCHLHQENSPTPRATTQQNLRDKRQSQLKFNWHLKKPQPG